MRSKNYSRHMYRARSPPSIPIPPVSKRKRPPPPHPHPCPSRSLYPIHIPQSLPHPHHPLAATSRNRTQATPGARTRASLWSRPARGGATSNGPGCRAQRRASAGLRVVGRVDGLVGGCESFATAAQALPVRRHLPVLKGHQLGVADGRTEIEQRDTRREKNHTPMRPSPSPGRFRARMPSDRSYAHMPRRGAMRI